MNRDWSATHQLSGYSIEMHNDQSILQILTDANQTLRTMSDRPDTEPTLTEITDATRALDLLLERSILAACRLRDVAINAQRTTELRDDAGGDATDTLFEYESLLTQVGVGGDTRRLMVGSALELLRPLGVRPACRKWNERERWDVDVDV